LDTNKIGDAKEKATTVVRDVIAKKGVYGRFTDRWFSKKGWTAEQRRKQGLSGEEDLQRIKSATNDPASLSDDRESPNESPPVEDAGPNLDASEHQIAPAEVAHVMESSRDPQIPLLPKLLTTTKIFFGSKSFFFSYDYDLSRSCSRQPDPSISQSLHSTFDSLVG
jgi:SacI homology domain